MRFLKQTDIDIYITPTILTKLTGGSSIKLNTAEIQAIGTFKKYIGKRYDVDFIIETQELDGEDIRDQFVVKLLCHILIYTLYSPLAPHEIPEHRKFDYQEAMEFLREVGRGDNDADFKLKSDTPVDDDTPSEIHINSYPKQDHRY